MNIESIINAHLSHLHDPLSKKSGFDMGLIPIIEKENNELKLKLIAGFPCSMLYEQYVPLLRQALEQALPEYKISLSLEIAIKGHRTQLAGKSLRGIKNTIAIASGKGGVGKSTVTVNLAAALMRAGARVGILDADIYGPSIPLMLGKTEPVQIAGERYLPVQAHGLQAMSIGYLNTEDNALIWRGPMLAKSLLHMLDLTQWDNLDYLFIDLPPGTGDIQLSLVQKIPLSAAIVVTTPQNVATIDAQKAIKMFAKTNIHVLGILENMSTHTCSQCGHHEAIFGHDGAKPLAKHYECAFLGQLPLDATIGQHAEQGIPIATTDHKLAWPFIQAAMNVSIELSKRPLNYADRFPPIRQS